MTLKLSRHALIWVTVLLYICDWLALVGIAKGVLLHNYLFSETQTTQKEGHAQNQEQVGQDGAKEGSLHNTNFILVSRSVNYLRHM